LACSLAAAPLAALPLAPPAFDSAPPAAAAELPPGAVARLPDMASGYSSAYDLNDYPALYDYAAHPDRTYCFAGPDGGLGIATVDPARASFTVEVRHPSTHAVLTTETISFADCPVWGGFLAGPDGRFYVALGRENPTESRSLIAVEIRRYSAAWELTGTARIAANATQQDFEGIYLPFDAGLARMALSGATLVLHMAREMFADGGVHHQSNITFKIDTRTMAAVSFDALGETLHQSPR
jgi:hypothetical protein